MARFLIKLLEVTREGSTDDLDLIPAYFGEAARDFRGGGVYSVRHFSAFCLIHEGWFGHDNLEVFCLADVEFNASVAGGLVGLMTD